MAMIYGAASLTLVFQLNGSQNSFLFPTFATVPLFLANKVPGQENLLLADGFGPLLNYYYLVLLWTRADDRSVVAGSSRSVTRAIMLFPTTWAASIVLHVQVQLCLLHGSVRTGLKFDAAQG